MYYNKNDREIGVRFTLLLTLFNYDPSLAQILPGHPCFLAIFCLEWKLLMNT